MDEYSRSGSLEVGKTARQTLLVGCSTVDGALDEAVVRDDGWYRALGHAPLSKPGEHVPIFGPRRELLDRYESTARDGQVFPNARAA